MSGSLYLVPNLLGLVPPENVLPQRTLDVARTLTTWIVETPKPARAFLSAVRMPVPIASLVIQPLPAPDAKADWPALLAPLMRGIDVGLLSDAGAPGVADPGAQIVAAAHDAGVRVVPLVGPSALLLGLMAAGMNGQRFAFHGYLPVKPQARADALTALELASRADDATQLFIETPYRNAAMIAALARTLAPSTLVCVAADLTLPSERIERRSAAQWRSVDAAAYDKRPALFLLHAAPAAVARSPRTRPRASS